MSYSENGIRTVILHIDWPLKRQIQDLSFLILSQDTYLHRPLLCSEEIMLLLPTVRSPSKHLADICYEHHTLLSMFVPEGAFPLISTSVGTTL